jgi:hypothetical protein
MQLGPDDLFLQPFAQEAGNPEIVFNNHRAHRFPTSTVSPIPEDRLKAGRK